jgi:hypothetical protein
MKPGPIKLGVGLVDQGDGKRRAAWRRHEATIAKDVATSGAVYGEYLRFVILTEHLPWPCIVTHIGQRNDEHQTCTPSQRPQRRAA